MVTCLARTGLRWLTATASAGVLSCTAQASAACDTPGNVRWQPGGTAAAVGELSWNAVPGAASYVVSLRESVPNGARLSTAQFVVSEPRLRVALAAAPALSKVLADVSARCDDASSAPAEFGFVVDRAQFCPPPAGVVVAGAGGRVQAAWDKPDGARQFEVRAYRLSDGLPLPVQGVSDGKATILVSGQAIIVAVATRCGASTSETAYAIHAPAPSS
jgi:hypothetical protein